MPNQNVARLVLAAVLVAASSLLALPAIVDACCPEPPGTNPGEKLSGPAVVGTATITPIGDGSSVSITFVGSCKGQPANFSQSPVSFAYSTVTEAALDELRPTSTSAFPGCYDFDGDLIINTVIKFQKSAEMAVADIVLLGVKLP